ncbi:MAG: 4-hydroxybutyrate CoA-transferase [Acidimicrobiales bacterium]|nr:4-hydroxybutyrate CoA-transferase [Acidimicrobiales bacterium]
MSLILTSLAESVSHINKRDTIGFGLGPGIPDAFMNASGERDDYEELIFGGALLLGYYSVLTKSSVSYRSGFFGPAERLLLSQGHKVELVPGGFRQFGPILRRLSPRVMIATGVADFDREEVNLSLHLGATYEELLRAGRDPNRLLIVEHNPNLPRTSTLEGFSNVISFEDIDLLVEGNSLPFPLPDVPPSDEDIEIAKIAASYVVNGATLQTGIGSIPTQVAELLATREGGNYGIHSEMFTTGLMKLHKAGKVTNENKGIFNGTSVTTFALGTPELYEWIDGNQNVSFLPVDVVNDPSLVAKNHALISINGALSVDLFGQVVADSIDGKQISGVGGHEDFVAAAELHPDAKSLICMRSSALVGGEIRSRITAKLPEGAIVSTPRHHIGVVVTEYGSCDLIGLTVKERALALAGIAHPNFRDELLKAAKRL